MNAPLTQGRQRDLCVLRDPGLWRCWPFLPVVRRAPDGGQQLGVLFDAVGACGRFGFSATVVLANIFLLPDNVEELFRLPRLVYDTPEEIVADGWRVD
jgi:hypothetical protein